MPVTWAEAHARANLDDQAIFSKDDLYIPPPNSECLYIYIYICISICTICYIYVRCVYSVNIYKFELIFRILCPICKCSHEGCTPPHPIPFPVACPCRPMWRLWHGVGWAGVNPLWVFLHIGYRLCTPRGHHMGNRQGDIIAL